MESKRRGGKKMTNREVSRNDCVQKARIAHTTQPLSFDLMGYPAITRTPASQRKSEQPDREKHRAVQQRKKADAHLGRTSNLGLWSGTSHNDRKGRKEGDVGK